MSSIAFLAATDFDLKGSQNKYLRLKLGGPVLVFFKMNSNESDPCRQFEPIFVQLSKTDPRISYGVLDISLHPNVVYMSRTSSTPITAVPVLILYINGVPHSKFSGNKNLPSLKNFITQALQMIPTAPGLGQGHPGSQSQGGNMYGGGPEPSQQRYQMATGPGLPPGPAGRGAKNMPEIGKAPSMKGILKGQGGAPPRQGGGYSAGGSYVEDDDDARLMVPDTVTPWNAPWESELQQNY
jgi:hypothetical protein